MPVKWEALLADRAAATPDAMAFGFLEGGRLSSQCSYGELLQRADAVAAWLQHSYGPGERVALLFPPGLAFVEAFFACTRAGLIPVPLSPSLGKHSHASIQPILINCAAKAVLGPKALWQRHLGAEAHGLAKGLDWSEVVEASRHLSGERQDATQGGIAFLQYTSGSTGDPKGVCVGHTNLSHNLQQIVHTCQTDDTSLIVSWLPHFHDMGLIGVILHALYLGRPALLMAPAEFTRRPLLWLQAISSYKATMTVAPNSALNLCERSAAAAGDISGLDLASLRTLVCGSEPIHQATLDRFQARFQSTGFGDGVLLCGYGLAEATLLVSGKRYRMEPGALVSNASTKATKATETPSCGSGISGQTIRIVDAVSLRELPDGQEGLIVVQGPSVNRGYWSSETANSQVFNLVIEDRAGQLQAGYLNTGDLGTRRDGELFITSRLKDLIIASGRNIHPQDVEEWAINFSAQLLPDRCAAFALATPDGGEQLVIVAEVMDDASDQECAALVSTLASELGQAFAVGIADVVLVAPRTIPLTTSGKLRRQEVKHCYQQNSLQSLASLKNNLAAVPSAGQETSASFGDAKALLVVIKRILARLRSIDPIVIDGDQTLADLALGSLELAELKVDLDQHLHVDLPIEPLLAPITLRELAEQLVEIALALPAMPEHQEAGAPIDDSGALAELIEGGMPDHLVELQQRHGDLVHLRWGHQDVHLLSEPHEVQALMQRPNSEFIRGDVFAGIRMVTDGNNLFTTEGEAWHHERSRAQPLFTRQSVELMAADFGPIASQCLNNRLRESDQTLNLSELSRAITLEITLRKLIGTVPEEASERIASLLEAAPDWLLPLHYLAGADVLDAASRGKASLVGLLPMLDDLFHTAIDQLDLAQPSGTINQVAKPIEGKGVGMLQAYAADPTVQQMEASERRSYLRSVMLSLLLAGLESTGAGLYFSLDLVARHPDVQAKLRQELIEASGSGQPIHTDLTSRLPYALAVVEEALRLFPPIWYLGRQAVSNTQLMGRPIAKGDLVITSPYVIHRDSRYWDDPGAFRPERFLHRVDGAKGLSPGSGSSLANHLYLPFGVGPRTCVGRWLALYEITLSVAALIHHHEIRSDGEDRPMLRSYFTLKTTRAIHLSVKPLS